MEDKMIELAKLVNEPLSNEKATARFMELWDEIAQELVDKKLHNNKLEAAIYLQGFCDAARVL